MNVTETGAILLDRYQVRKSKKQKTAFLDFMKERYPQAVVEEGGVLHNRNLVIGDVDHARFLLTAHYDTCAQLPFPNFITPKNIPLYLAYNILICIPFFLVGMLCRYLAGWITDSDWLRYWASLIGFIASFDLLFFGKANRHTVNDNTSGVLTLIEAYEAMTQQEREQVALVFFDNEENGLLGSMYFARVHRQMMRNKLLLNFDCVSDGDELMLVMQKGALQWEDELRAAFLPDEGKNVRLEKSSNTLYPSDQSNFDCGVGFAALKMKKGAGLYLDRIHTHRDTVLDERNIACLVKGIQRMIQNMHE